VLLRPDYCLLGGLQISGVLLLFLLLKLDGFLSAWAENLDSYYYVFLRPDSSLLGLQNLDSYIIHA
jgi:hypothetical protein